MKPEIIMDIAILEDRLRKFSEDFTQSREFVRLPGSNDGKTISLDLKDILTIGAIRNAGILNTGKSGAGKTHLAKMAMNAFFGQGHYVNKTVTPGMNEEAFLDIDFGKIKGGSTLKQAISSTPILTEPGVILNEVNRAPGLIQNILIPYLENEFNIKGLDLPVGIKLPNGDRYQFRILTMNEGGKYRGISEMDKAVRDRMVIEIPIDQFKSLKQDIRDMILRRKSSSIAVEECKESLTDKVTGLCQEISSIPLSSMASEFLVYISGLSNCIKSSTGSKEGIDFTLDMCKGCHHAAAENNICGNVYSPTNRSLLNLQSVGKGVAALRAYKSLVDAINSASSDSKKRKAVAEFMESDYLKDIEVTTEDIVALAPFILYSKIDVNEQWVKKFYEGNKFIAVKGVVSSAYSRFISFYRDHGRSLAGYMVSGDQQAMVAFLQKYSKEKDAWMSNIRDFENRLHDYSPEIGKVIGSYAK